MDSFLIEAIKWIDKKAQTDWQTWLPAFLGIFLLGLIIGLLMGVWLGRRRGRRTVRRMREDHKEHLASKDQHLKSKDRHLEDLNSEVQYLRGSQKLLVGDLRRAYDYVIVEGLLAYQRITTAAQFGDEE